MIDGFVEGVRSITQVCQLVILAPLGLMIIAARGRWAAVAGAVGGAVVGGWLFVTNRFGAITDLELRVSALLVIAAAVILAFPQLLGRRGAATVRSRPGVALICGGSGILVVQWWRPCVGTELGSLLTEAPGDPWGQFLPAVGFMLGMSTPLLVLGLIFSTWRPAAAASRALGWSATVLTVALAGSVLAGHHGEIVSRLFEWSQ